MPNSADWQIAGLRPLVELLATNGPSMRYQDVMEALREQLKPSGEDLETTSNGSEKWWNYIAWGATGLSGSGAEWITKDGGGVWTITDAGRQALEEFPDPKDFRAESNRIYKELYKAKADQTTRRAWLVRGSSVLGVNLVPKWLDEGWCSLAASQLPAITPGVGHEELAALAESSYQHLNDQERRSKVEEIVDFACRMKPGDVVLTTDDDGVFIGDLEADVEYVASDHGQSNLRRRITWRNPETAVNFGDLPGSLQAKLKSGATVVDITGELEAIQGLTLAALDEEERDPAGTRPPHVNFEPLTTAVAMDLLVDAGWLNELVELLNEKRQLVLYGPPGTGKTYLARKIAAHLAGEERVRLVQFHPSYTYEDFFEGFRPAAKETSGTVSLELRAGPLRRLATEAKEHRDRAFILVIDELNRANIAKVFGELYFLLEYRDEGVEVLYGGEPFTLPPNLYFIGTMNTADRSIALLDSAMRRRFAFMELHPATQPTASMLAKWLERKELPATASTLLSLLNARIDDRDSHIGPSYFMTDDQSRDHLERIFRTQIRPLLQETYYDRWTSVAETFNFNTLYASATHTARARDMTTVEITETGPGKEFDLTVGQASALAASNIASVSPMPRGRWLVSGSGMVGVARIGDMTVRATPKLPIDRLFFLLGYGRGFNWRDDLVPYDTTSDLVHVLADAFVRQADRALGRGVIQGYVERDDELAVVRGRMRPLEQVTRRFGQIVPLLVRYDDFTIDIAENQLVRAAAQVLRTVPGLDPSVARRLRAITQTLDDVTDLVPGRSLPVWRSNRRNAHYETVLWFASMVLRHHSINLPVGQIDVNGFVIDMAAVFEDFVTAALTDALESIDGQVRPQDPQTLDVDGRVKMKPDLVWYRAGNRVAVIDAKYKAETRYPNADLYQLLAYCTAMGLHVGHLVYAKGNGDEHRNRVRASGIELRTHALNLELEPSELLDQVAVLANNIEGCL